MPLRVRSVWASGALIWALTVSTGAVSAQESDRDAEARGLFVAGEAAFDAGRFEDALRYFQESYALSPRPGLLFNIGQAADRARFDEVALDAFRRFLASEPAFPEDERRRLELRVAALEAAVSRAAVPESIAVEPAADERAASASLPPSTVPSVASPGGPDGVGVGLLVGGGLLLVGGGVLTGVGAPDTGALGAPREGETYPQAQARQDAGSALVASGLVGLGVSAVLAAIGAIVLTAEPTARGRARLGPSGVEVRF